MDLRLAKPGESVAQSPAWLAQIERGRRGRRLGFPSKEWLALPGWYAPGHRRPTADPTSRCLLLERGASSLDRFTRTRGRSLDRVHRERTTDGRTVGRSPFSSCRRVGWVRPTRPSPVGSSLTWPGARSSEPLVRVGARWVCSASHPEADDGGEHGDEEDGIGEGECEPQRGDGDDDAAAGRSVLPGELGGRSDPGAGSCFPGRAMSANEKAANDRLHLRRSAAKTKSHWPREHRHQTSAHHIPRTERGRNATSVRPRANRSSSREARTTFRGWVVRSCLPGLGLRRRPSAR